MYLFGACDDLRLYFDIGVNEHSSFVFLRFNVSFFFLLFFCVCDASINDFTGICLASDRRSAVCVCIVCAWDELDIELIDSDWLMTTSLSFYLHMRQFLQSHFFSLQTAIHFVYSILSFSFPSFLVVIIIVFWFCCWFRL